MAQALPARRPAPRYEDEPRVARRPAAPAPRAGARAAARATRLFFVLVVCLAALGVGRVALSFAVVQKSLETDAVRVEQRRLAAENADLAAQVVRLGSTARIRAIAKAQLGLVPAERPIYLTVTVAHDAATGGPARR